MVALSMAKLCQSWRYLNKNLYGGVEMIV